jgi:hypothetical protein
LLHPVKLPAESLPLGVVNLAGIKKMPRAIVGLDGEAGHGRNPFGTLKVYTIDRPTARLTAVCHGSRTFWIL